MRLLGRMAWIGLLAVAAVAARPAAAETLSADRAVQIALKNNSQVIGAEAGVLVARGELYSAYSGLVPSVEASVSRSGSWVTDQTGNRALGRFVTAKTTVFEGESYATTPEVSATWSPLNLSAITGLSAARGNMRAAGLQRQATRSDVALAVRQQFYSVVQAIQLAQVNIEALRLARDNGRRVQALFEVGSVSKSDVLKSQVQTAQSELDSLTARQAVIVQRNRLAAQLGMREGELGEIDTVLTATPREYEEAAVLGEAERARPDLLAVEASLRAARSALRSAQFARLPFVSVTGYAQFGARTSSKSDVPDTYGEEDGVPPTDPRYGQDIPGSRISLPSGYETDRQVGGTVALSWNIFNLGTDSRVASARAGLLRARDARDALRRNLASEVHEALLAYGEALERDRVASRALESAMENLKLTQQKYNVGSATILDLIDAQVQLQRSRSQQVSALAAIRVAEAAIERVRGRGFE